MLIIKIDRWPPQVWTTWVHLLLIFCNSKYYRTSGILWLDGNHWLNAHEFEQTLGDGKGPGSLVWCSPWGCKESNTTEQLKNMSIVGWIHRCRGTSEWRDDYKYKQINSCIAQGSTVLRYIKIWNVKLSCKNFKWLTIKLWMIMA